MSNASKNQNDINQNSLPQSSELPKEVNEPRVQKVQNPVGDKTIVCWNCLSVLMVKEIWSIVECTTCGKYNRVPDNDDGKQKKQLIEINENQNHFDLQVPYVFGIITCPFCQTENRFKRDSDHVVCYKCHHSFTCKNSLPKENSFIHPGQEYTCHGSITIKNYDEKVLRYSDYYYPDMMYFRGYYPQPFIISSCDCSGTENILRKLYKTLKKKKKPIVIPPPVDRFAPLRQFVRDIDDIDSRRSFNLYRNMSDSCISGIRGNQYQRGNSLQSLERYKNNIYDDVYGGNKLNIDSGYGDYLTMKNDAINKMMFLGGANRRYENNPLY